MDFPDIVMYMMLNMILKGRLEQGICEPQSTVKT